MEYSSPDGVNRRLLLGALACLGWGTGCSRRKEPGPVVEVSFQVQEEPGPRSLSDFRGRVVVVGLWTTGCLACDQQLSVLARLHEKHSNSGLICVGLYDSGQAFMAAGLPILIGAIDANQAAVLPKERPAVLVLDREGRRVEQFEELVDEEDLDGVVKPLLGV